MLTDRAAQTTPGASRTVAFTFFGGRLGGGSPAGGGSCGSDISGLREGGSSTGFFRRLGGSRLGAGGRLADPAWAIMNRIGRLARRLRYSLSIVCSAISKPPET